jgi:predicted PurR-regulated permease PerM
MTAKQVFQGTLVVLLTLLGAYLVYRLRTLVISVLIAFIFASAISPLVTRLNRRLPLASSIGLVYLGLIAVVAALLAIIITPLAQQTGTLISTAPDLLGAAQTRLAELQDRFDLPGDLLTPNLQGYYGDLAQRAPALAAGVLNITVGFFTGLAGMLVVLVLAFYWLLERRDVEGTWLSLVPARHRGEAREIIEEIEGKLGAYVRGQLILALIVGILSFAGLLILRVPYSLVLALIGGVGEMIPLIGPFVGAVPAVIIAFATTSPQTAIFVAILYFGIQQTENNLLVPKVMHRSVGLSPMTVLLAVLAGGTLLGIIGALLAVPTASAAQVILKRTLFRNQHYVMQSGGGT